MDPQFVDKIVHEVKSQGLFDEFRKDSIADVDTKPAYQNLRQRVDTAVVRFLSEQKWSPEINKNQLRERLRRNITESGFLEIGVERIVDQVVNPKIGSVFKPRIEEIVYRYLGVPLPSSQVKTDNPPLLTQFEPLPRIHGAPLKIETGDLLPTDLELVSPDSDKAPIKSECKRGLQDMDVDTDEYTDKEDEESPPFEPLTMKCPSPRKDEPMSQNSNNTFISNDNQTVGLLEDTPNTIGLGLQVVENPNQPFLNQASQDSQLSRISSETHNSHVFQPACGQNISMETTINLQNTLTVNISEEAQMPKFNENSGDNAKDCELHFDIKKDEIKFEGTDRKVNFPPIESDIKDCTHEEQLNLNKDISTDPSIEESGLSFSCTSIGNNNIPPLKGSKANYESPSFRNGNECKSPQLCYSNGEESKFNLNNTRDVSYSVRENSSSSSSSRNNKHSKNGHRKLSREIYSKEKKERVDSHTESTVKSKNLSKSNTSKHSLDEKIKSRHSSRRDRDLKKVNEHQYNNESDHDREKDVSLPTRKHRNSKKIYDDHNEAKFKGARRKSTDSSEEDKSSSETTSKLCLGGTPASYMTTKENGSKKCNSSQSKDQHKVQQHKVILLNEILQSPLTNFVELETKANELNDNMQVICRTSESQSLNLNKFRVIDVGEVEELLFFEETLKYPLEERLKTLEDAIFRHQQIFKYKMCSNKELYNMKSINKERRQKGFHWSDFNSTYGILQSKLSPTISDTSSINSKENEVVDEIAPVANSDHQLHTPMFDSRINTNAKLSQQQRYKNDDLYKPRPILSQRSRRRGLDSSI